MIFLCILYIRGCFVLQRARLPAAKLGRSALDHAGGKGAIQLAQITELFLFGRLKGIYQCVKIAPVKKITAQTADFCSGKEKMDIDFKLSAFMKDKNILLEGKRLHTGGAGVNHRELLWLGSHNSRRFSIFSILGHFWRTPKTGSSALPRLARSILKGSRSEIPSIKQQAF